MEPIGTDYDTRWSLLRALALFGALAVIVVCAATATATTLVGPQLARVTGKIVIAPTNPAPVPSGTPTNYTINFNCSAVGATSCGDDPTITIPISDVSPASADPDTWTYSASSGVNGLILSQEYDPATNSYVIHLDPDKVHPGVSYTINFSVTQPNNVTPDGTTWSTDPSFKTSDLLPTHADTPATGEATADAKIAVSKDTNDGGSVYVVGNQVIYNITARCNAGGASGNLYLTKGSLVDTLPPNETFVSATPTPTSVDTSSTPNTVTWDYPDSQSLPAGCSADGTGTTTYQLVVELDPNTPDDTSVDNSVTFSGTPIHTVIPKQTTADKIITAITKSPPSPGNGFIGKSALGPLNIPNYGFAATYAGHWITPTNPRPANAPGSAEGEYRVTISYPASRAFETAIADPVPCLDNKAGVVYSSNTPSGDISDPASVDNLCQNPAFNPTVVQVNSASLPQAAAGGWTPTGIRPDGSTFQLTLNGTAGTSAYYEVPSADVGQVAAILLPANSSLTDVRMSMYVFGYGDKTLVGGDVLHNIATATAYPMNPSAGNAGPFTQSYAADLYIEDETPQLGVYKSFGTLRAGPGGTTALNITGHLTAAHPLPGPVIISDLLPYAMTWSNPATTVKATIKDSAGASTTVDAKVEDIINYNNTGRELIRIEVPSDAIVSGFYTITFPSGFVYVSVPTGAQTYNNFVDEFVKGVGQNTQPDCGQGTGTTASTFESSDSLDLSGTGVKDINYCEWGASLKVPPPSGPAYALQKTVQGSNDPAPVYPLGIGNTTVGGPATYTLTWTNTGAEDLKGAVIYDILPYVGDTGVSQGEDKKHRDSQFATIFTGVVQPLPPGVTVEYSQSTNPCRPEVFADADNPDCVNDWTTTEPTPAAKVKALKFVSANAYSTSESWAVQFTVRLPINQVNTVAWNSAAAGAQTSGGVQLLPAEPPKVGITAKGPKRTPRIATRDSATQIQGGDAVHDTITLTRTGGGAGTIHWKLLGPLEPKSDGGCSGLDWTGAPVVDEGTIDTLGNGSYTTPDSHPTDQGCYGYWTELNGDVFAHPVFSLPGRQDSEVLLAADQSRLLITKVPDHDEIALGQPVTYKIVVRNVGDHDAYGVSVTDSPKSPMTFISAKPSQGRCGKGFPLTCEVGTIKAHEKATIEVTAKPTETGDARNEATERSVNPGPPRHWDANVVVVDGLKIVKKALSPTVKAGRFVRFRVVVSNPYRVPFRNVTACDQMPAGLEFVHSSKPTHLEDGNICWTFSIRGHSSVTNTITTEALSGDACTRITNTATVSGRKIERRKAKASVKVICRKKPPTHVTG